MPKEINDWDVSTDVTKMIYKVREDMMYLQQEFPKFATKEELQSVSAQVNELANAVQSIPTADAIGEAVAARLGAPSIPPIERARMRLEGWKLVVALLIALAGSSGLTMLLSKIGW